MTLIEAPIIARMHKIHTARGLTVIEVPECLLCQEAAKPKPAWLAHLSARELTTRRTLA